MEVFLFGASLRLDLNRPSAKTQILYRNLNVQEEILKILQLKYNDSLSEIFKHCYIFFKVFVQHNPINQDILFPQLNFMLSQMGMKLGVAETLISLIKVIFQKLERFLFRRIIMLFAVN